VIISLTKNKSTGNPFGSIMKLVERDGDPLSLEFSTSVFLAGGSDTGFACPDNLAFDRNGNLWMCSDIAGHSMNKDPYKEFGNNGLFYIPFSGKGAGRAHMVATAPPGAEFTGPCFAPDGETLFLSVQHPGEEVPEKMQRNSLWPGNGPLAKPSVIAISGPKLKELLS
jgi:secreted PhoX family phosphatase